MQHFGLSTRQRRRLIQLVLSLALAWFVSFAQQQGWLAQAADSAERHQPGLYAVTEFVDGDTVVIDMNGKPERVRMIGVDTPETHKPNTPVQCYGPAASAFTKNVIGQQRLRLESDPYTTNRDRYNRLLRYVYLPDGTLMNKRLIEEGYGFNYPYFPFTKSDEFAIAQNLAMGAQKGLWGNCAPTKTERGGYISNEISS